MAISPAVERKLLFCVFCALSLAAVFYHEPWRDEALHWLIARDAAGLFGLFRQLGYEGTPGLWNLLLMPLAKLGAAYRAMQGLHCLIICAAAYLVVFKSPFSILEKALILFGYFFLYEYNAIARSYSLSALLLFTAAVIYPKRLANALPYALILALLANTNIHGTILAIVLTAAYFYEARNARLVNSYALAAAAAGIALAIIQVLPPADIAPISGQWHFTLSLERLQFAADAINGAFVPVPKPTLNFWNTLLLYYFSPYFAPLAAPLFLLTFLAAARRNIMPAIIYAGGSLALLAFFYLKYGGFLRHYGLIFVFFIFCLWLETSYEFNPPFKKVSRSFTTGVLSALLCLQAAAASVAVYYDSVYEFSAGGRAAAFLRPAAGEETLIACYPSFTAQSVLAYLPGVKFYFLEDEEFRTHIISNAKYAASCRLTLDELIARTKRAASGHKTVYLVVNQPIKSRKFESEFKLAAGFNGTIAEDESFYIYRLETLP